MCRFAAEASPYAAVSVLTFLVRNCSSIACLVANDRRLLDLELVTKTLVYCCGWLNAAAEGVRKWAYT